MRVFILLLCLLTAAQLAAAPITIKEIEFLVRQQIPENEIVQDVATRRLLSPIDAQAEQTLKKSGASDALIARLKSAAKTLSAAEMQAEAKRQADNQARLQSEAMADTQRAAQPVVPPGATIQQASITEVMDLLKGKLIKLDGDTPVAFDAGKLSNTFHFAFYYSASWCGPCQKFTPKLIEGYKKLKEQYPDFELIFVSNDHNEKEMIRYMVKHQMPWPAVRYKDIDDSVNKWAGQSIPWLVGVNPLGIGETSNAILGKSVNPEKILKEISDLLEGKPQEIYIK